MRAEKSTCPQARTGDTSATNSASHPPAKQTASQVRIDRRLGASRQRRRNPVINKSAERTSETVTSGSKLQARTRSCQLCGLPSWNKRIGLAQRRKGAKKDAKENLHSSLRPPLRLCAFA